MLGKRIINTGGEVSCTTDTTQILDAGTTQSIALYRFEDNAYDTAYASSQSIVSSNKVIDLNVNGYSSGSTITDSTSNSNNATIVGNVTYSNPSGSNGRFNLDGASDYLRISASATFNSAANFTVEGWFKPDNITDLDHFFTIWDSGSNAKLYLRFNGTAGDLNGYVYTSSGGQAANLVTSNSAVRVQANKFNHIVMTYTDGGSGSLAIYINGALAGSATPGAAVNTTGTQDLYIGVLQSYIGSYDFDGEVGQVRFYSSALTASEVLQNFNATRALYTAYDGVSSGVTYVTGKFGKAASYDGSGDQITASNFASLSQVGISMWVNMPNISQQAGLIARYGTNREFAIYMYSGNLTASIYYNGNNGNATQVTASTYMSNNTWHHIAYTANGSTAPKLYIDGSEVGTPQHTDAAKCAYYTSSEPLDIGHFANNSSYNYEGKIDQVRIFSKELSPGEVNSLYNETTTTAALGTISNPSTIAYYKMQDATDETGSYNGTATNVDFNVQGKYGFAGLFNGTNSKISTSLTSLPESFTISCWANAHKASDNYHVIVGNYTTAGGWYLAMNNSMKFVFYNKSGSSASYYQSTATYQYGEWYHFCVVFTHNSDIKAFINGNKETFSASIPAGTNSNGVQIGVVGTYSSSTNTEFDGKIDQVRIFNKAISDVEVTKLYNEVQCANTITTPESYFNTKLYTGTGSAQSITGVGFEPGFVWIKSRTANSYPNNVLQDSVRGPNQYVISDLANAQGTNATFGSFDANGFTLTSGNVTWNGSGSDYVSWNWKAGSLINKSAYFNGSSSKIVLPDNILPDNSTGSSSASVWFRSSSGNTAGDSECILDAYAHDNNKPGWSFFMEPAFGGNPDGHLYLANYSLGGTSGGTSAGYRDGKWHHAAIVLDNPNDTIKVYLDGNTTTPVLSQTASVANVWPFTEMAAIGYQRLSSGDIRYFNGNINQVRIFNKALSASEITTLYNETASTINTLQILGDTSCVAAYLLGTNANDLDTSTPKNATANANVVFNKPGHLTRNNNGTIESTVSALPESGFSVVKYTGNNTDGATVGHGLSFAPEIIIIKNLDSNSTNWMVKVPSIMTDDKNYLYLNDTSAVQTAGSTTFIKTVNSSIFTLGTSGQTNATDDFIAYCFHSIDGYQRIGSYAGNGSADGPFVYTGFEPAWLMIKRTDAAAEWNIFDNKRDTENPRDITLWAQANSSESTASQSGVYDVDFLSNGFQIKNTYNPFNNSSGTYLFWAIAANPDTTAPTKTNSFKAITWAGSGGATNITTVGFKPDLVLWKAVDSASYNWKAINSIRGASRNVYPNLTNAEASDVATTAFIDNGFSFGSGGNGNVSSLNFVGYAWKGLDHDRNLAAINNDGSRPSLVSANPDAGFSVVQHRSAGTFEQFGVGHGLSSAPQAIIMKALTTTGDWYLLTNVIDGSGDYIKFNDVTVKVDITGSASSLFRFDPKTFTNWWSSANTIINFCFHSVDGVSRIATYTGVTGAKRVYTTDDGTSTGSGGFSPSFIIIRNVFVAGAWMVYDSARSSTPDPLNKSLMINYASQEVVQGTYTINVHSDGFTVNSNLGATNANGNTYFYIAFA